MNRLNTMEPSTACDGPSPYPVYTAGFWKRYWIHMRPYLLFISGIAGLAGTALVDRPDLFHVILVAIPGFLGYGLGQAMTDVFQTDTDSISSSYRPLVKGEVSKVSVFTVSLAGLLITPLPLLMYTHVLLIIPLLMAVIGLILYTPFKRRWWGGPFWNSWIVALLPLIGYMAVSPDLRPGILSNQERAIPLGFATLSIFFAYANFVVGGYFKDISADRATGYETVQVRFGWRAGALFSDAMAVLAFVFTFLALAPKMTGNLFAATVSMVILVVSGIVNLRAQIQLHGTRDESKTHEPIASIVRAFILYCSAILVAYQPGWMLFIAVYYGIFEWTLKSRPEKSQV